ncbi:MULTISPECIES: hypothetical protein [unclassified Pseudovibrio]|uniref:hypothetical protein n=1 Tax=unclassified Pseudovibrio TaxID=2627060 RepID=UPI00187D4753|nr:MULTISPECIES: hypothetical protein [unclassified Pseudovibrio]
MSDEELSDELHQLDAKFKKLPRFREITKEVTALFPNEPQITLLYCEWVMEEYAETPDGFMNLVVLLNSETVSKIGVPTVVEEPVELGRLQSVYDYLKTATPSQKRQLEIALERQNGAH